MRSKADRSSVATVVRRPKKAGPMRSVDRAGDLEDPAVDQRRDGKQDAGPRDGGAVTEDRHRVVDEPEEGQQAIHAAVRRVVVEAEAALHRLTGQVWVRTCRCCR
jgi:hypothetical protein